MSEEQTYTQPLHVDEAEPQIQKKKINPWTPTSMFNLAALCLAVMSWYTTSQGLIAYAFKDSEWAAYVISFAIQTMLFVCNLKLPAWCKSARGWSSILIPLFTTLLLASSFFSYVFFSNLLYTKNLRQEDAPSLMTQMFSEYKSETEKYIDEALKISQTKAGNAASALLELMPDVTPAEIAEKESQITDADTRRAAALVVYYDTLSNNDPTDDDFWAAQIGDIDEELKNLKEELRFLQQGKDQCVNVLLAELLSPDPKTAVLESSMKEINDRVMASAKTSGATVPTTVAATTTVPAGTTVAPSGTDESFTNIIQYTQTLSNAIKDYIILREQQSTVEAIKYMGSVQIQNLKDLGNAILKLPPKPEDNDNKIIQRFNPTKTARNINALVRAQSGQLSQLEISTNLLRGYLNLYPTLAVLSLFFALLLDVASMMAGLVSYILKERKSFSARDKEKDALLKQTVIEAHYESETEHQVILSDKKMKRLRRKRLRIQLKHNLKYNFLEWVHSWPIFKDS